MAKTATGFDPESFGHKPAVSTGKDDGDDQHPDIDGENELEPCVSIGSHSIIETCLKAKVQIQPGHKYCEYIELVEWQKNTSVHLNNNNICVKYQAV